MRRWFKARWQEYVDSSDPDVAMSGSQPGGIVFVVLFLCTVFAAFEYVPFLQRFTGLSHAWVSIGLSVAGGILTYIAYRHRCRGTIGALASLLDNAFYSSALAFAAMNMTGNPAIAMAAFHGIALVMFQGQLYAFSPLLAVTLASPIALMLVILQPEWPVAFITVTSTIALLTFTTVTGNRRAAAKRQAELEQALVAANKVADESVQAALTTTLLTLGHFLHELRNYQSAVSANLAYVEMKAVMDEGTLQALQDAQQAQGAEEELVRSTIEDLRARSSPAQTTFLLSESLERARSHALDVRFIVEPMDFDLEVSGNPEHLGVVLLNLVRNAEQAGAKVVRVEARSEASGQIAQVLLHDDGPGLDTEKRDRLFDTFALSTKPGGSGLGLYLVRRYVELLGGRIEAQVGPMGGAAFLIRLPGRMRTLATVSGVPHALPMTEAS